MKSLENKIDFAMVINVNNANSNGDPLNGNRPRINYDGFGEISDVCIKRKMRNRLMEMEGVDPVFVQSNDNKIDGYRSLRERAEGELKESLQDENKCRTEACKKWFDVRAFGQVFAYTGTNKKGKGKGKGKVETVEEAVDEEKAVSVGVRGPVSIHSAFSVAPISISTIQITKSVNNEGDGSKKTSDTMGMKHRVDHGVYVCYGSINPQLASKTGFSDEDAGVIKKVLCGLFENDASSARPEGSMEVHKVYWWKHNSKNGQYSSAKVHRSLEVTLKDCSMEPKSINDYNITVHPLDDLIPEIIEGR